MPGYTFSPFGGVSLENQTFGPYQDLARKDKMAQTLLQMGAQDNAGTGTIAGALGKALAMGMSGYMMGQNNRDFESRQQDTRDTLARALQAGQGGGSVFNSTTGEWTDNAKPDTSLMAKVLASNPDTAGIGLQTAAQNIQANDALRRQQEMQDRTFAQQKEMQQGQQEFQRGQTESQQAFQERMAKQGQEFQRTMGQPLMVPDRTSSTGFRYANPHDAIGQEAYNPNALFAPTGASPAGTPGADLHGDDFLKTLSPAAAETVKGLAEGRIPVSPMMVRTPQGMQMLAAASQYDPTFDASNYQARAAMRKNYMGGGKQFQELQAIGTVAGHLKDFSEAADALNNSDVPFFNSITNAIRQGTGDPRVDRFNTVKQAVTNELSKAYRGGQVTEGDVKEWQSNISAAKSPDQLRGVIGQLNDLLMSKRQALEEGFKSTMGPIQPPSEFSSVNERTKGIFDNISKWAHGETAQAPSAGNIDRDSALAELRRRGVIQ